MSLRTASSVTLGSDVAVYKLTDNQQERDQFALALIDGDGLIFQQALLSNGADGGSEAAHLLLQAIRDHLHTRYDNGASYSIMVHIVANFEGLSRKLASVGILRSPAELNHFARAFSINQPLFSFVDVGPGKERADHKIREMFRIFINNMQCRQIIFGGCHDNGYIPTLEPYKRDEEISKRITLLESTPAQPGFQNLGYDITSFPSVFRSDPLPESRVVPERALPQRHISNGASDFRPQPSHFVPNEHTSAGQAAPGNVFSSSSPSTSTSSSLDPKQSSTPVSASPVSSTVMQATMPVRVAAVPMKSPGKAHATPSTWAAVGNNDTVPKTINIASTKPTVRKAIFLNGDQHRIDTALPKADESASRAVQSRIKHQGKLCNTWHLNNRCNNSSGSGCEFSHEPKLSTAERNALRHKARELPCFKSGSCRDYDCTVSLLVDDGETCWKLWSLTINSLAIIVPEDRVVRTMNGASTTTGMLSLCLWVEMY